MMSKEQSKTEQKKGQETPDNNIATQENLATPEDGLALAEPVSPEALAAELKKELAEAEQKAQEKLGQGASGASRTGKY